MKSAPQLNLTSFKIAKLLTHTLVSCTFSLHSTTLYAATVLSTSVFGLPNSEFTHIIIETNQAASHSMMILKNPHRVVLDLKNTPINESLILLTKKDFLEDLSIKQVRVGNFKAGITRVVFDLKTEVKAVFSVAKPKGTSQYRLMLDLQPLHNNHKSTDQKNAISNPASKDLTKEGLSSADTKSTGAKIILEPNYEDEEVLMDEYEQF
jgi:N-acetylmuramoyl-L-alanine amidase